jgi:glutamate-1-semialdehyde 2,1-aminomutase
VSDNGGVSPDPTPHASRTATSASTASDAPASAALLERARAVTPGGVNSPVRAFRAVGGTPRFMASGRGPYLTDVDGREYVDLVCSWGPMILGHAHPAVLVPSARPPLAGSASAPPRRTRCCSPRRSSPASSPVQQVRLVSSGTEATMSAIRLARGFTGRSLVVKFAGHYHGHVDSLLVSAGSGLATFALPDSAGVPAEMAAETLVLPYNDVDALEAVFAARGSEIACLVTEAAAGNMGVVPPDPGFTQALRRVTAEHGALLVSDEVMTGFRCQSRRLVGSRRARPGARPDDVRQGHGWGLSRGSVRRPGRRHGPARPRRAGLPGGHPLREPGRHRGRAGHAARLRRRALRPPREVSSAIADAASAALGAAGVPHRVQWAGSMFSVFFREGAVRTYDDAREQDAAAFGRFFHAMLDAGGVPAAERLRVVVRLRGARRRCRRARPRRPAGGGPGSGRARLSGPSGSTWPAASAGVLAASAGCWRDHMTPGREVP